MADTALNNLFGPPRRSQALSKSESEWVPAEVETCRIINVNITDWSVDCVSEYGGKRYFDVQVMSPYLHFANGEGIYTQPEVGALCWVCTPSGGRFAPPFVMGFQTAYDTDEAFRAGRLTLNPGDIMLRTRDENFVALRRGGVLQLGSTPLCQSMYVPIGNILRHFCEQYELNTFGGSLVWKNARTEETTDGEAHTTLTLSAKEKVNSPAHDVVLTVGSHGDGEPTRLELNLFESGAQDAKVKVHLDMSKEGDVNWQIEQNWALIAEKDITLLSNKGSGTFDFYDSLTLSASNGNAYLKSGQADVIAEASKGNAIIRAGTQTTVDSPKIALGGSATSPVVKGDKLVELLGEMILAISLFASAAPGSPTVGALSFASFANKLSGLLSSKSFTE